MDYIDYKHSTDTEKSEEAAEEVNKRLESTLNIRSRLSAMAEVEYRADATGAHTALQSEVFELVVAKT